MKYSSNGLIQSSIDVTIRVDCLNFSSDTSSLAFCSIFLGYTISAWRYEQPKNVTVFQRSCVVVQEIISTTKKANKLRIRDFWEKLQEDQYFGYSKVEGKKEWIKSADYDEITTKKIASEVKNNYKAVFKHGRTRNEWKIDVDAIIEHRPTNTIRLRLERQLLPILMKGVNDVKGFQGWGR